jgi:pimeloyl-ACP methyl ester carboxylesterase
VIPDTGHLSEVQSPARFNGELREFLRSVSP